MYQIAMLYLKLHKVICQLLYLNKVGWGKKSCFSKGMYFARNGFQGPKW